jgi:zinc D-Ala-D-Ala carboxypeptidase
MLITDWDKYPNFSKSEFDCTFTGDNLMQAEFMDKLQELRTLYGKPMVVTSGYRSPKHPIEAHKSQPGMHSTGLACDIGCNGQDAYTILKIALSLGFTGIGISQKAGLPRFIHLDLRPIKDSRVFGY